MKLQLLVARNILISVGQLESLKNEVSQTVAYFSDMFYLNSLPSDKNALRWWLNGEPVRLMT